MVSVYFNPYNGLMESKYILDYFIGLPVVQT